MYIVFELSVGIVPQDTLFYILPLSVPPSAVAYICAFWGILIVSPTIHLYPCTLSLSLSHTHTHTHTHTRTHTHSHTHTHTGGGG